jgi:hypothetical protein
VLRRPVLNLHRRRRHFLFRFGRHAIVGCGLSLLPALRDFFFVHLVINHALLLHEAKPLRHLTDAVFDACPF